MLTAVLRSGLYKTKKYLRRTSQRNDRRMPDDEDLCFFDIEGDLRYESMIPGTVTLKGFGLECWDYELSFGKRRPDYITISSGELTPIRDSQILRRLHELQGVKSKFGWNTVQEALDLKEFSGITR